MEEAAKAGVIRPGVTGDFDIRNFFNSVEWRAIRRSVQERVVEVVAASVAWEQKVPLNFDHGPEQGETFGAVKAVIFITQHLIAVSSQFTASSTHARQVCRALRGSSTTREQSRYPLLAAVQWLGVMPRLVSKSFSSRASSRWGIARILDKRSLGHCHVGCHQDTVRKSHPVGPACLVHKCPYNSRLGE